MSEPVARPYTPTALPPVTARLLAFLAILLGGLCGGLIGYSVADLQCGADERSAAVAEADEGTDDDGCGTIEGLGALVGALAGAGGVAIVAILALRAMAEWRRELDVDEPPGPVTPG